MDVKSLYSSIPNPDGLMALKHYLNSRTDQIVSTVTVLRVAELVLIINCLSFDGRFYTQMSGTMMGTPFGPEYACLFMGYQELLIRNTYLGPQPILYLRYIDDVFGISTMSNDTILIVNGDHIDTSL